MLQETSSKRILIVDDNHEAADVLAEMLVLSGCEARCAYDGRAAIELAHGFSPDAILLDLGMPGMDGLEVAAALRAQARFAQTRVVAFTAWGDPATRAKTKKAGFDEHVVKPASLPAILEALAIR